MTSSNTGSTLNNIVHGEGNWAPGTTVREIEGHFNPRNEPQGAAPISESGGVPKVDYNTSIGDKARNALTGDQGTNSTQGTLGSHHHSGTGSGLTGSDSGLTGSSHTGSGLTGSHGAHHDSSLTGSTGSGHGLGSTTGSSTTGAGTTGATGGLAQRAENALDSRTSTTGTGSHTTHGHHSAGNHGTGVSGEGVAGAATGAGLAAPHAGAGTTGTHSGVTSGNAANVGSFGEVTDHKRHTSEVASSQHNTADEPLTGGKHTGAHHTTGTTSAGGHGHQPAGESQTHQKEGFLDKIKHALH